MLCWLKELGCRWNVLLVTELVLILIIITKPILKQFIIATLCLSNQTLMIMNVNSSQVNHVAYYIISGLELQTLVQGRVLCYVLISHEIAFLRHF
jgi:hypothetical protein